MHLSIQQMEGGVFEPVRIEHARITHESQAGTATLVDIGQARATFAWARLLWQRENGIWQELALEDVQGTIDLPADSDLSHAAASLLRSPSPNHSPRLALPSALLVKNANILIRQNHDSIRLEGIDFQASDVAPGPILIRSAFIRQPWLTSVFSNCHGTLALKDSQLVLADLKLTDSLSVSSASADLEKLLQGRLEMQFSLAAFSGTIAGDLKSGAREEHLIFDGSGNFSNISVAQLGAFFGQDAGGSIKGGTFTFHGSPRDLARATFTTRFEAADFRWGARRWNSLVAGATYVNRRLIHMEFALRQSHNSLILRGETGIPEDWSRWWQTDFNFQIEAKINALSELSALLGPAFGDIYGSLNVDGSIQGANSSFNGQLIASGEHLSFRTAPLDEFQAALKLQGNEIQVTNAEFVHGTDFLRGRGVVNILGEKRYWGEVRASVADLSLYSPFLQPPLAPQAFGGGLALSWSGDGTASAHSGAFKLALHRIRPLGPEDAPSWNPIDLTAEATYSPESIYFSNLLLGDRSTTLGGVVVATPHSLTLQNLQLQHGKTTWLSGNAQIPLNVWAAWKNPNTAQWLDYTGPCKVALKLNQLSLGDTLLLTGRALPYQGEATGTVNLDGTLSHLAGQGSLSLWSAALALPSGMLKDAGATIDLEGPRAVVESASGVWNGLSWSGSGDISAGDVRSPLLDLALQVPSVTIPFAPGAQAQLSFDVHAGGPPSLLTLSGAAHLLSLELPGAASTEDLVSNFHAGLTPPFPPLLLPGPAAWQLDLSLIGDALTTLANTKGRLIPTLHIGGTLGRPRVTGSFQLKDFALPRFNLVAASVFLDDDPAEVSFVAKGEGQVGAASFDGYWYGTLGGQAFHLEPGNYREPRQSLHPPASLRRALRHRAGISGRRRAGSLR